ncbi:YeeE/YedE family protein [Pseudomonas sp. Marseille-Q8238]
MTIDWPNFTWLPALLGGLLIGLASAVLLLWNKRIAGVSGILGGLLRLTPQDRAWRIAFILGLLLAPSLYHLISERPAVRIETSWPLLLVSGLLVGFGTRLGSGCTSGHGICGLARNAPRSWAATLTFMLAGIVTVFVIRHLLGSAQ